MVVRIRLSVAARQRACAQSNFPRSSGSLCNAGCVGVRVVALLGRRELLHALEELDQELGALNVRGEVFIIGGAAMAIAYDTRRATSDVDAVFVSSSEVRAAGWGRV